ncbi:MAG: chorismate synthase [Phycisphaerales bacterium]
MTLAYSTAGESHGPALVATVSGYPSGAPVDTAFINRELARRQGGYGRGGRQRIETDTAEILTGVRNGRAIGSPITLLIRNADSRLDDPARTPPVHTPRPGHADLAGSVKYLTTDCRETLERASARETAARVAAGALVRALLLEIGIEAFGFVRSIHTRATTAAITPEALPALLAARDASETYCPDTAATARQVEIIHTAKTQKTTVGGLIEAHVFGCPPGLGSTMDRRDRLDARLAGAVMGIQAIKGVEVGLGLAAAGLFGHEVHDPISFDPGATERADLGFLRATNNAGGIEGGMTNGAPVVVRAAMKPISTLLRGMPSVNLNTKQAAQSDYERSDICAVSAASVVLENVVAFEIATVALEKFRADTLMEFKDGYRRFMSVARSLPLAPGTEFA